MKYVYVAGPYSAPTDGERQHNVNCAINAGNMFLDAGLWPYVPHLSHYQHAYKARDYEQWMALDFAWLSKCDALYRMAGASKGADREVEYAKKAKIPVFHAAKDLIDWAHANHRLETAKDGKLYGSGIGVAQTPMVDKPDWSLLAWDEIEDVVRVMEHGARKYKRDDWMEHYKIAPGPELTLFPKIMRHLRARQRGQLDPETKKSPLAHVMADTMIWMWHDNHGKESK